MIKLYLNENSYELRKSDKLDGKVVSQDSEGKLYIELPLETLVRNDMDLFSYNGQLYRLSIYENIKPLDGDLILYKGKFLKIFKEPFYLDDGEYLDLKFVKILVKI